MKRCCRCKKTLSFTLFYKDKSRKDGFQPRCNNCKYELQVDWKKKNWEKVNLKAKNEYWKNPNLYKNRARKRWLESPEKVKIATNKWRRKNVDKIADYRLRKLYSISLVDKTVLLEKQNGKCLVCKEAKKLYVDHDHVNGEVRGLLCHVCNILVGYFEKSPTRWDSVKQYLEEEE